MKQPRFHTLLVLVAVLAAGVGCDGGTRACKQGTVFVTIVLNGPPSSADEIGVSVSVDGGPAKSSRNQRTPGGRSETIEINFENGYPTGKRVDVQVTAYMGGSAIATKTGTVASLPDGCAALTVTPEAGGSTGSGGAAGRGGAGGSTGGAAGRGGTSGAGGGLGGRGGTGGAVVVCPGIATFDTDGLQGFVLNNYMDTSANAIVNIAVRDAGARATIAWSGTEGDPSPGSLKVDAPFDAYKQYIDVQRSFSTAMPNNWTGYKLHVRVKVMGGNSNPATPMGVQPYAMTGTTFDYCGNYVNLAGGGGWNDYVLDLTSCPSPVDPSKVVTYGVSVHTGTYSNSVLPMTATIHVDNFWLEGSCSGTGAGGRGGAGGGLAGSGGAGGGLAGRGGTGGGLAGRGGTGGGSAGTGGTVVGCPASDVPPSALISDFSMMDGGTAVIPLGGPFTYGPPGPPPLAPTATVQNGAWRITLTAPGMAGAQYTGVGIFFNGPANYMNCIDATSYTGVSFKLAGSVTGTGCSVQYATGDKQHEVAAMGGKGSGPAGSYPPQITVPPAQITAAGQVINVPFVGAGAPTGGSPATAIDKAWLTSLQWQFTVQAGTANVCNVDVTLDDVRFY